MEWTCTCGRSHGDRDLFCSDCGTPRPGRAEGRSSPSESLSRTADNRESRPAEAASKKRKILILAAGLGALALLAVCFVGIIAAIAIPAFVNASHAKERARQTTAMEDMRRLADACETYRQRQGEYPPRMQGSEGTGFKTVDSSILVGVLGANRCCLGCPVTDPWGHEYSYGVNSDASRFILICNGSDGIRKAERVPDDHVGTHCFEDDIIWADGGFIQEPEGNQKKCK